MTYDFSGYATRSNVKCSDGRTIMPDAFRDDDGKKVPLVWNHQHNSPDNVLGHAILENRPDGVYAYATFNDNEIGQRAKELVRHGDISALSIYANKLKETAGKVMHGVIREVSLVLAGANPEALIDSFVAHSDGNVVEDREQGLFYSGLDGELYHAADDEEEEAEDTDNKAENSEETDAEKESRQKRLEKLRELRKRAIADLKNKSASEGHEEEADDASDDSDADAGQDDSENDEEEDEDRKVRHADSDESDGENELEKVMDSLTDEQKAVVMVMLQSALDEAGKKNKNTKDAEPEEDTDDEEVAHADSDTEETKTKTLGDILDTFTDEQKVVVMALLEDALEKANNKSEEDEEDEEEPEMKHNVFDNESMEENVLSHSDEMKILEMAKDSSIGTLKGAMKAFCDNTELAHGFDTQSLSILFPEYQDVKPGAPEMLTTDQGWITKVLNKVHKIPMTKVRVRFADIRNIEEIRAKGYKKGTQKAVNGDISALYRVADAQTVYVRSDLSRDDILDMTDFDYVAYMYGVDKMLLNEELATAIMLGDGRAVSDQYKIKEDRIIPIWTDDELFTIHAAIDFDAAKTKLQGTNTNTYFGENFIYAEAFVEALMNARVDAKNSGQADLYIAPKALNKMLLARDRNGRRIYNTLEELRSAMNVREIITAEQFEGKTRTKDNKTYELLGILTKMENYDLGANKGGEITHFTDFDLDFNKEKSLLETHVSGMQVRPLSSVVLETEVTT